MNYVLKTAIKDVHYIWVKIVKAAILFNRNDQGLILFFVRIWTTLLSSFLLKII